MYIAIIDNIKIDSDVLTLYLSKYFNENHLYIQIETFHTIQSFKQTYQPNMFDIIFLDNLTKKPAGIELAKEIRDLGDTCLLIFSTANPNYAVEGFRVHAYDYLIKPYSYEQFSKTMDYCKQDLLRRSRYIEVKEGRNIIKILLQDIIYTDYYNHYIQIHTKQRIVRYYCSFSNFSKMLLPYPQFLSCYRNCIINMNEVESVTQTDFVMKNQESIPISRTNRKEIHQRYYDYKFFQTLEFS